jgi:hypothetical protein
VELTIKSVVPVAFKVGEKPVIEVWLRNIGSTPFYLPASQNAREVRKPGNRNRRTFLFGVEFVSANVQKEALVETTHGSDSMEESLIRLEPQQAALVRFYVNWSPISEWPQQGIKEVDIKAICSEWILEDDRYFIKDQSERIQSLNSVQIPIQQTNQ